ncbi:MAG: hypothetical protein AB7R89_13740 [Dehalococcoidia bacterium]
MPRRAKPVQSFMFEPGDIVTVGPNPLLRAEGTVGVFLFYSECGPPIIEVEGDRWLMPERCLTVHERPCAVEPEPDSDVPAELAPDQSDRLLTFMAERDKRGATLSPYRAPARRTAIMPLAWETRTEQGEPTLPQQIGKAQWDATGLAAWVDRLQPTNDLEQVALHELFRALRETRYWLQQFAVAREMVTA